MYRLHFRIATTGRRTRISSTSTWFWFFRIWFWNHILNLLFFTRTKFKVFNFLFSLFNIMGHLKFWSKTFCYYFILLVYLTVLTCVVTYTFANFNSLTWHHFWWGVYLLFIRDLELFLRCYYFFDVWFLFYVFVEI